MTAARSLTTEPRKPRLRVVSLFCGCGGFDMGLCRAAQELGIEVEVVAAYDSWPKAVEVYNANLPHPVAQVADLKQMQREDLPPHDLVIGGPPCQPFSMAGQRRGHSDERNCLPDFLRLAGDSPFVMENVVPRLINAPFSVKLCAADFGDVTSRKRWFYSSHLLHVIETPGPRRIRDIRDHAEDERILKKRGLCKAGNHGHYDSLDSLQSHSWHGHDVRGSGKLVAIAAQSGREAVALADSDVMPSAFANLSHGITESMIYRLGLRGSRIVACRNPSLLEMARAHSIPDTFDWCGATKTDRGKMIANSIPVGMAAGVSNAILRALIAERQVA